MTRYSTRPDAVAAEIIEPLEVGESSAAEYDVEAIADEVIVHIEVRDSHGNEVLTSSGYEIREDLDHDKFWAVVAKHALPTAPAP